MNDDASIEQIVQALRDYVAAHPHAADSVRGISEWWLASLSPAPIAAQLAAALAQLEGEGLFGCEFLPDGTEFWRALPRE